MGVGMGLVSTIVYQKYNERLAIFLEGIEKKVEDFEHKVDFYEDEVLQDYYDSVSGGTVPVPLGRPVATDQYHKPKPVPQIDFDPAKWAKTHPESAIPATQRNAKIW